MIYPLNRRWFSKSRSDKSLTSFTLVELAIVFGVIALFLGLVFPRLPFVSQEKTKIDARSVISTLSNIMEETLKRKTSLKLMVSRKSSELIVFRCTPTHYRDEKWEEREEELERLRAELGLALPFRFEELIATVCEWKEVSRRKLSSEITSVFVEGEEMFGEEVEILFQSINIPFVEIELDKKIWVILNPYIFRVFLDTKPAHRI